MSEIPIEAVREWLLLRMSAMGGQHLEHEGEKYIVRLAGQDGDATQYAVTDLARKEVARFEVRWGAFERIETAEVAPVLNEAASPIIPVDNEPGGLLDIPEVPAPEPEWIEGQWGPTKIRGGYSYEKTPCNGDVVYSAADGGEWLVLQSLTAGNPHKVVVQNPVTGVKFPFGPKWETAVKFKRGEVGKAIGLLQDILGAVEIEDESAKSQGNWIIGGRRGGHR